MANNAYEPCACGSGKKFKFCCYQNRKVLEGLSDSDLIKKSAEFPIYEVHISRDWQESGLAQIVVVRQLPNLKYLVAVYLIDIFCLGLKDTFLKPQLKYQDVIEFLSYFPEELVECSFEDARSIVLGSIEYAKQLGFEPHRDWKKTNAIIEHERDFERKFKFGKDGLPLYIQGPNDDTQKIMAKLNPLIEKSMAHFVSEADLKGDIDDFDGNQLLAEAIKKHTGLTVDQYMENKEKFEAAFKHMTSGRFENAIEGFSEVLKIEPNHVQSNGNIGIAYASMGDLESGMKHFDRAIELDPNYQPAIENRKLAMKLAPGEKLNSKEIQEIDFYAEKRQADQGALYLSDLVDSRSTKSKKSSLKNRFKEIIFGNN